MNGLHRLVRWGFVRGAAKEPGWVNDCIPCAKYACPVVEYAVISAGCC